MERSLGVTIGSEKYGSIENSASVTFQQVVNIFENAVARVLKSDEIRKIEKMYKANIDKGRDFWARAAKDERIIA